MKINRHNCEALFLDYYEKNLSPVEVAELLFFLEENTDLKEVFESYEAIYLEHEKINFPDKESLKKKYSREELDAVLSSDINGTNCEQFFIANAEGILSSSQKEKLKLFLIEYPGQKGEFELFQKCKLSVEKISFEEKTSLKKRERKPVFVSLFSQRTAYYAAAAAILLLVGLFFIFRNNETDKQIFADKPNNENKTIVSVKKENAETPVKQEEQKEEIKLQPIIFEDTQNLVAEKEQEKPQLMEKEVIAEKKQEEKKETEININQAIASAVTAKSNDEYQTLGSFARKKIKSALGIKDVNPCEAEDKITVWDLAMAAKNGIQNLLGTKAVDISKVCGGTGESEYVFTAGNFEISRSASK